MQSIPTLIIIKPKQENAGIQQSSYPPQPPQSIAPSQPLQTPQPPHTPPNETTHPQSPQPIKAPHNQQEKSPKKSLLEILFPLSVKHKEEAHTQEENKRPADIDAEKKIQEEEGKMFKNRYFVSYIFNLL